MLEQKSDVGYQRALIFNSGIYDFDFFKKGYSESLVVKKVNWFMFWKAYWKYVSLDIALDPAIPLWEFILIK